MLSIHIDLGLPLGRLDGTPPQFLTNVNESLDSYDGWFSGFPRYYGQAFPSAPDMPFEIQEQPS